MDIDDILAELDQETTVVNTDPYFEGSNQETVVKEYSESQINPVDDYDNLIIHWRNERMAPELLKYPLHLMDRMFSRIADQMMHIENLSMGYLDNGDTNAFTNKLPLLCMEAEIERVKFVMRSFIRCRLNKIDKYSLYLRQLNQDEKSTISLDDLLSKQELEYYHKHSDILLKLLNNTILKHMPPELQLIDDTEGSISMIDEPDLSQFVFIFVSGGKPGEIDHFLTKNDEGQPCYSVIIEDLNEVVDLTIGGIYAMRYIVIKNLLLEGKVILI